MNNEAFPLFGWCVLLWIVGGANVGLYKSGSVHSIPMNKSDLQQILERVERIGASNNEPQAQPPAFQSRRLRSADTSEIWPEAYRWLKSEANRLGWVVCKAIEVTDSRRITGRIAFVLGPMEAGTVQVRRGDGISFSIRDGEQGLPLIYLKKENWDGEYLVYHEYNFSSDAIYSMSVFLNATDEMSVVNSRFKDVLDDNDLRRTLEQFSWWGVLLRTELENYEQNDPRAVEINRILRGWQI